MSSYFWNAFQIMKYLLYFNQPVANLFCFYLLLFRKNPAKQNIFGHAALSLPGPLQNSRSDERERQLFLPTANTMDS